MNPKEKLKAALAAKDEKDRLEKIEAQRVAWEKDINNKRKIKTYQDAVEKLNAQIAVWIDDLGIEISNTQVDISEWIGSYDVTGITLSRSNISLSFTPMGCDVVSDSGGSGSIQLKIKHEGTASLGRIVLKEIGDSGTFEWIFIYSSSTRLIPQLFDDKCLYEILTNIFA